MNLKKSRFSKGLIGLLLALAFVTPVSAYVVQKGDTPFGLWGAKWRTELVKYGISDPRKLPVGLNVDVEPVIGGTLPVAGVNYALAGSGVTASAASFTLTSLTIPQSGRLLVDADFSSTFYITFEPGNTKRQEISACTTVVQNANGTATISGCSRGMLPFSPYTASSTYAFPHAGGTTVIFSDPPQLFNEYASKLNNEIVTGTWTFNTPPVVSSTTYIPTNPAEFTTLYALNQATSTGGLNATTLIKGVSEIAASSEVTAGTATGDSGATLVVPASQWLEHADESISNNIDNGETITAYNIMYVSSTGKHMIAHGNVQGELDKVDSVAFEGGTSGSFIKALFPGSIVFDSGLSMTTGSLVYVSDSGRASTTPGTIRKVIGVAYGTNTWQFRLNPEQTNLNPASSTQYTIPVLNVSSTLALGFTGQVFGNCSDGNVTISASTTLTRDMFYNSLTINAGVIVTTSNWRIYSCTSITNNGTITNSGLNGSNGSTSNGGAGGVGITGGSMTGGLSGGAGGAGGLVVGGGSAGSNGTSLAYSMILTSGAAGGLAASHGGQSGGAGGTAGTATLESSNFGLVFTTSSLALGAETTLGKINAVYGLSSGKITAAPGSAGGGGGGVNGAGGNYGGGGGGGGAAGGPIYLAAPTITNNSVVTSTGGIGGNGAAGNVGGTGGGGGGGAGGLVIFVYNTFSGNAPGVAGGAGGTGNASGSNGSAGNFIKVKLPYSTF